MKKKIVYHLGGIEWFVYHARQTQFYPNKSLSKCHNLGCCTSISGCANVVNRWAFHLVTGKWFCVYLGHLWCAPIGFHAMHDEFRDFHVAKLTQKSRYIIKLHVEALHQCIGAEPHAEGNFRYTERLPIEQNYNTFIRIICSLNWCDACCMEMFAWKCETKERRWTPIAYCTWVSMSIRLSMIVIP